jgi:hypothetical protein
MGRDLRGISQAELVKIIEDTKKGSLLDISVDEDIYWVSYIDNDDSFVVDTIIDAPKYFDTSSETADYLSGIYTGK